MEMAKLRAAIVGAGKIAGLLDGPFVTHAGAMAGHDDFVVDGICEPDDQRRARFAERWGIANLYRDLDGLLTDGPWDLVAVCSPDATHATLLCQLLEDPCPPRLVVLEKPPCCSLAEMEALAPLADRPVIVNLSRRFDAGHRAVRRMIEDRELGEPVNARWIHYGGWFHNGIHVVDTLRLLFGGSLEVVDVRRGHDGRPGDPCLEGEFRTTSFPRVPVVIEGFPESAFQLFEGEIRFSNGRIRLLDFGADIRIDRVVENAIGERELKVSEPLIAEPGDPPMQVLYDCCAEYLANGSPSPIEQAGLAVALDSMRVLFEARERMSA